MSYRVRWGVGIVSPSAKPANAASQAKWMTGWAALGYRWVRVNAALPEYVTIGASPTFTPTYDSTGLEAMLTAAASSGLKVQLIILPQFAETANTAALQGGTVYVSTRIQPGTANIAWDRLTSAVQHIITTAADTWAALGQAPEGLVIEWSNEYGWGGNMGARGVSTAEDANAATLTYSGASIAPGGGGYGTLDLAVAGSAGYAAGWGGAGTKTTSKQDTYASSDMALGWGTWDTDADWDSLATFTGKADYANVRGLHDLSEYVLLQIDWEGLRGVFPPFEAELSTAWFASNGTLASDVLTQELATAKPNGYTWYDLTPGGAPWLLSAHLYIGSTAKWPGARPGPKRIAKEYRALWREIQNTISVHASFSTHYAQVGLWCDECGLLASEMRAAGGLWERERGAFLCALRDAGRQIGDSWCQFTGVNESASEDASASTEYGIIRSTGAWSAAMLCIAAGAGMPMDESAPPPDGTGLASWAVATASGEPAVT